MTRDSGSRDPRLAPLDDAGLGRLVGEVVESWDMPPVRLDQPGWRDRVRTPWARRLDAIGGGLRRVGRATTAAVALTVAAALVAVYLTRPPGIGPGSSASPGTPASPGASPGTSGPTSTTLPKLVVQGEIPSPSSGYLLVDGAAGIARFDLTKGSLEGVAFEGGWPSAVRQLPDGTPACLCITYGDLVNGDHTSATIELVRGLGDAATRTAIATVRGVPASGVGGAPVPDPPPSVLTDVSFSADGRSGYVGWTVREADAWRSGVIVVDLERAEIVAEVALPDRPTSDEDSNVVVWAPDVVGIAGPALFVARPSLGWMAESLEGRLEVFEVAAAGGTPKLLPAADGCGQWVERAGRLADGTTWLLCLGAGTGVNVLRRIGPDGVAIDGDLRVPTFGDLDGSTSAVAPDGTTLFLWHPMDLKLTVVDLELGVIAFEFRSNATAGAGSRDPWTALGRWLAPEAAAKILLRSGLVVSPDGGRVYALGIRIGLEGVGSAGIFAFDVLPDGLGISGTRWEPTASFVSLAMSADGRFLYATGMPGADATGGQSRQPASMTVYDAATGEVRLIAGDLGRQLLTFADGVLR